MITAPDASGGSGSFPGNLWNTLTQGIQLVAAGELSRRYGFAFGADGQIAPNANGEIRAAAAPASDVGVGDKLSAAISNPLVIIGAIAAVALVVVLVRR